MEPTLTGRYFSTTGAASSPPDLYHDECTESDVENVDGSDAELHIGANFGYSMRIGLFELALPVIGVTAGYCFECIGGGALFLGSADPVMTWYDERMPARRSRVNLALNLNVARVGARF